MGAKVWLKILLLATTFSHSLCFGAELLEIGNGFSWKLERAGKVNPISIGARLTNQLHYLRSGERIVYEVTINKYDLSKSEGMLIPFLGGALEVLLNGVTIFTSSDIDHEGLIVPMKMLGTQNKLQIVVVCNSPMYCGLWRDTPTLGQVSDLLEIRDRKLRRDRYLPLFTGLFLVGASLFFFACYITLRRRYKSYLIFALTLISWGIFYVSFSGILRSYSPFLSNLIHFSLRTIAAAFTALLISTYSNSYRTCKRIAGPIVGSLILAQLYAGYNNLVFFNILITIVASTLSVFTLFTFRWSKLDKIRRFVFIASVVAAVGQMHDAAILLNGFGSIKVNSKFINQFTFPPLILASFAVHITEFLNQFKVLRSTLLKVRKFTKASIRVSSEKWDSDSLRYLLKEIASATKVERASFAERNDADQYSLVAGIGINQSYVGTQINLDINRFALEAIASGEVCFGSIPSRASWKSDRFIAIPVPKMPNPRFLLFLSDPKDLEVFDKSQAAFLSQISSMFWSFFKRTDEEARRLTAEKKFGTLVQRLDPSLYNFIANNLDRFDGAASSSDIRGIVFFDQKSYSSMTENFDDATMGYFANLVGEWVTKSTARYGARISNFAGDAFLLETYCIGSETEESIAMRTLNLVWTLAHTLGELNQILMKNGFSPITFRFGAHIGHVTTANLDFIQKGLSNSVGDTVNVASRLQGLAKAGAIYISGELASFAKEKFLIIEIPKQYVKGRNSKISIFSLVGKVDDDRQEEEAA